MRTPFAIVGALLILSATCQPALATPAACPMVEPVYGGDSPRVRHGSVSHRGHAYDYAVLLPSDYEGSTRSYPVLYFLHGVGGGEDYLFTADTPNFIEELTAEEPVIVVIMDGGLVGMYADWPGDPDRQYETVHTGPLIRHIDDTYRTIPDRRHRAVAGISMGGFGAIGYAERHPEVFGVAGSFSAILDTRPIRSPVSSAFGGTFTAAFPMICMDGMKPFGPFGDPVTNRATWERINPAGNVEKLRRTVVYAAVGNGVPCDLADLRTLAEQGAMRAIEPFMRESNVKFARAMRRAGLPMTFDDYGCGIHGWRYWERDFRTFWPLMRAAFAGVPAASSSSPAGR